MNQTITTMGDGNAQYVAGRDIVFPQPPSDHAHAHREESKPWPLRWWVGIVLIGGMTIGTAAPLVIGRLHDSETLVRSTPAAGMPVRIATTISTSPHRSAPGQVTAALSVSHTTPPPPPRSTSVTQVSLEPSTPAVPVVQEPKAWPDGKSALCNNGEFSASHSRSGTCSQNGGVAHWRYPADDPYWSRRGTEA